MGKAKRKDYRTEATDPNGNLHVLEDADAKAGNKRWRRVGVVERMARNKELTPHEIGAADRFETDYFKSRLAPKYAQASYGAVVGGEVDELAAAKAEKAKRYAQRRVMLALSHVGPRAGAVLERCVGLGEALKGAGGIQRAEEKALLRGALSALVGYYFPDSCDSS